LLRGQFREALSALRHTQRKAKRNPLSRSEARRFEVLASQVRVYLDAQAAA
jgi:hypothetical protein